ncbi:5-formyltetrahydrofolate cyclo-ligase [Intrasporangium chromatireducens Q5-1]|uniref:5-formyltetrahydrofolate cyclo-ligase n=1 Tax=Intrasporangium chromatireducens Q5-1 TaxID=584657 RepID=W9GTE6_9MICO|nr:5-formyltetrahydrofolate cyclo-ligase [Intrasporangium chromatireducens]EWT07154.1 5-formyltetrahydrofolate cyclo-ligase [Intrasporangium chromatireducens Q5-1]
MGPVSAKADVRRAARVRRRGLAADLDREAAAEAIATTVLRIVPAGARTAAYLSLPEEPPTGRLVDALLEAGHEVIVPITLGDFTLEWTYAAHGAVADVARVARGTVPEGTAVLGPEALATCGLIVVPGLVVDTRGARLGQGGGCYDRALRHRRPGTPVVALLHEGEESEELLPLEAHDQLVDGYVTTSGRLVWLRGEPPG